MTVAMLSLVSCSSNDGEQEKPFTVCPVEQAKFFDKRSDKVDYHTGEKREYSLEAHRWKSRETITLKPEEKQILTFSAQGYTMKEIAGQMLRSFDTVKFYRRQIFEKLDVQNITEALSLATSYGLVLAVIPTVLTYFVTQMGNFSSPRCRITHLGSRFIWQFAYFCEPARHLRTIENHRESNSLESSAFCRKFASENFQT